MPLVVVEDHLLFDRVAQSEGNGFSVVGCGTHTGCNLKHLGRYCFLQIASLESSRTGNLEFAAGFIDLGTAAAPTQFIELAAVAADVGSGGSVFATLGEGVEVLVDYHGHIVVLARCRNCKGKC